MSRDVRAFDYVNHPFEQVRDELMANAAGVLRSATHAASSRAETVAAELHVEVGGLRVSTPIDIESGTPAENNRGPGRTRMLQFPIRWKAAERSNLFPVMHAELSVYPLTATETQLDFKGQYDPPLGAIGAVIDAAVGHRIAEASIHSFVADIARHLRTTLG